MTAFRGTIIPSWLKQRLQSGSGIYLESEKRKEKQNPKNCVCVWSGVSNTSIVTVLCEAQGNGRTVVFANVRWAWLPFYCLFDKQFFLSDNKVLFKMETYNKNSYRLFKNYCHEIQCSLERWALKAEIFTVGKHHMETSGGSDGEEFVTSTSRFFKLTFLWSCYC